MSNIQQLMSEHLDIWLNAQDVKKSRRGRGSTNKDKIYGVQKLRELILDLAFIGRLVPSTHDINLYIKMVNQEREQLIKDKIIKKSSLHIKDVKNHYTRELPENWIVVTLGDVGYNLGQKTPDKDFNYIDVSAIDNHKGTVSDPMIISFEDAPSRARKIVKLGTVIYSTIRPYLKNIAVIEKDFKYEAIASTAFAVIHPYKMVLSRYLLGYLRSPFFIGYVESVQMGIAYPAINDKQFYNGLIPIPPLEEQQRIVEKIDELMALCDQLEQQQNLSQNTHKNLVETLLNALTLSVDADEFQQNWQRISANFDLIFTTEHSIEQLKQTVLQLAIMGKLVKQNPSDQPATVLLEKIKIEKEKLIEEGKIKRSKPKTKISEIKKFIIPDKWAWIDLHEISTKITDGTHHTPTYTENGIPFLSVKDMSSGYLNFDDTKFISKEEHDQLFKRCNPEKGDLLLTKVGTTGIPIIVNTNSEFSVFVSVALIKSLWNLVNIEYLKYTIESPFVKKQSVDGTEGVGNKNLVLHKIENFSIPFPPLAEQQRIVAKVDELFNLIDNFQKIQLKLESNKKLLADALVISAI